MRKTELSAPDQAAGSGQQTTVTLDLRGLRCPMPVLRTRKALASMVSGSCLVVECTDPLAGLDIPHFVNQSGDTLVSVDNRDGSHVFCIRKR